MVGSLSRIICAGAFQQRLNINKETDREKVACAKDEKKAEKPLKITWNRKGNKERREEIVEMNGIIRASSSMHFYSLQVKIVLDT